MEQREEAKQDFTVLRQNFDVNIGRSALGPQFV
jgi:hypothetical protein